MRIKTTAFTIITILLIFSCQGKSENNGEAVRNDENKVNLTVNRDQANNETVPTSQPPSSDDPPRAASPSEQPAPSKEHFLSGRTELLSLPVKETIKAEGFSIGGLYYEIDATSEEKQIIDNCKIFMEEMAEKRFQQNLVIEKRRFEIKDFWEYFISGKIDFNEVIYGRPLRVGGERQVQILLRPVNLQGRLYLEKNGAQWLISGLEMDLREKTAESSQEIWAPSVKPTPFGY